MLSTTQLPSGTSDLANAILNSIVSDTFMDVKLSEDSMSKVLGNSVKENEARCQTHTMLI